MNSTYIQASACNAPADDEANESQVRAIAPRRITEALKKFELKKKINIKLHTSLAWKWAAAKTKKNNIFLNKYLYVLYVILQKWLHTPARRYENNL